MIVYCSIQVKTEVFIVPETYVEGETERVLTTEVTRKSFTWGSGFGDNHTVRPRLGPTGR